MKYIIYSVLIFSLAIILIDAQGARGGGGGSRGGGSRGSGFRSNAIF